MQLWCVALLVSRTMSAAEVPTQPSRAGRGLGLSKGRVRALVRNIFSMGKVRDCEKLNFYRCSEKAAGLKPQKKCLV